MEGTLDTECRNTNVEVIRHFECRNTNMEVTLNTKCCDTNVKVTLDTEFRNAILVAKYLEG